MYVEKLLTHLHSADCECLHWSDLYGKMSRNRFHCHIVMKINYYVLIPIIHWSLSLKATGMYLLMVKHLRHH